MSNDNVSDTGSGIIVGVEPAQPRRAADWQGGNPAQQVSQPQPQQQAPQEQRPAYRWTDEDLEAARVQEKEKLYGRLNDVQSQIQSLQEEREQERAERERLAQEAEAARQAREEQEMGVRELLEKRDREFREALEERDRRYEADRQIYEKERQLAEAEIYRRDRIEQEANDILPELRDFVGGNSPEEIDRSIEAIKQRTAMIVQNFVSAEQPPVPFQPRMGAAPTAPPVGPMEQQSAQLNLNDPEVLRDMDMDTYKKIRPQLLQAANPTNSRRG
jgi:hypothetical protein